MTYFDFRELFIYDLANNHQGDIEHARNIIKAVAEKNNAARVRGALKFQFRQLDSFIHPEFQGRTDIKFIKRFEETKLDNFAFADLAQFVKANGLFTMSTPFDEASVDVICDLDLDLIKIASCSADDWPLLEKVARINKPLVVSTAGLSVKQIDRLVNFLETENAHFALMHCVAIYPTPNDKLQLNQIEHFRSRYKNVPIGWSTHEDQNNLDAIKLAYAKGARLFERHVGLKTKNYDLNEYSSSPEQLERWLQAYHDARNMLGAEERAPASLKETETLNSLKRGVYTSKKISKGEILTRDKVFFAMPLGEGQLISGQWHKNMIADRDYEKHEPLPSAIQTSTSDDEQIIYEIMLQVRAMLNNANIYINDDAQIELSHHYGLNRFREYGAVIISCINRQYAKKLVVQLPRQKHPYHFHKKKEETFQLLYGDLEIVKNGTRFQLKTGDTCLVEPETWHKFHTLGGAIFEEISTTHYNNDSFYEDPKIAHMERSERKTNVDQWLSYFRSHHGQNVRSDLHNVSE